VSVSLDQAYAICEAVARREAKNFYYAFRALPKPKRSAICAVYAFMRHADDLADDERLPREERLRQTERWLAEWHRTVTGEPSDNPVFIALRDTQRRFQISSELLDQLVQGTLMDLTVPAGQMVYRTFDDLYRYCYLVASVVGLVCIRIFGYNDSCAEKLAEETGVAFQLTNILRDVREDAERGRLYLPLDDLKHCHVTVEALSSFRGARKLTADERRLMELEAERARAYYAAADRLLPLIDADSRAALWVLVRIYRRLLERIVATRYEVLSKRIRVPTLEKIWILLCGSCMAFRLGRARNV
jgi:phytoene synthase